MSLPFPGCTPTRATAYADDKKALYRILADYIRLYAARRGYSPQSVEYSVIYAA